MVSSKTPARRKADNPELKVIEAAVDALHPGGNLLTPVERPTMPAARLADAEAELLDWAIDRYAQSGGRPGDLARSIIVLRAEING